MNKFENIVERMREKGYEAKVTTVTKNSVEFQAISLAFSSKMGIHVYGSEFERMLENLSEKEIVDALLSVYEKAKQEDSACCTNLTKEMSEKSFLLENVYLGLQKKTNEEIVKKFYPDFNDLEGYLYLRAPGENGAFYTMNITSSHLTKAGITEEELWEVAEKNTRSEAKIQNIFDFMDKSLDIPSNEVLEVDFPMYTLTNEILMKGAAAVLCKSLLSDFAKEQNAKRIFVLPSSIHEVILLPDDGKYTEEDICWMNETVRIANATDLEPQEVLSDRVYIVEV